MRTIIITFIALVAGTASFSDKSFADETLTDQHSRRQFIRMLPAATCAGLAVSANASEKNLTLSRTRSRTGSD